MRGRGGGFSLSISVCMYVCRMEGGWVVSVTFNSCLTVSYEHRGSEPLSFLHGRPFVCLFVCLRVCGAASAGVCPIFKLSSIEAQHRRYVWVIFEGWMCGCA